MSGESVTKTVSEIIAEQYNNLFSERIVAPSKLGDLEILAEIHDQVIVPATGIFILEDSDDTADESRLSSKQYAAFLSQVIDRTVDVEALENILTFLEEKLDPSFNTELLIKISQSIHKNNLEKLQNLETFQRMMRIAYDREAVFLEMVKSKFFEKKSSSSEKPASHEHVSKMARDDDSVEPAAQAVRDNEKNNIQLFLEWILNGFWVKYSRLEAILLEEKTKQQDEKKYERLEAFLRELVNQIGSATVPDVLGETTSDVKVQASKKEFSGDTENLSQHKALASSNFASKHLVLSSEAHSSPPQSPISFLSPKHDPAECAYVRRISGFQHEHEESLKQFRNKLMMRINEYLKIRVQNLEDTRPNVNTWRNLFHNKEITEKKASDAKALIKEIQINDINQIKKLLTDSIRKNSELQNTAHTFWKRNEGEYGACLKECLSILETENHLELSTAKREAYLDITKNDLLSLQKIKQHTQAILKLDTCIAIKDYLKKNNLVKKNPAQALRKSF